MPTKKQSIFQVSGKEPPKEKLPTLKQFIKENPDVSYPQTLVVNLIWFPGQWNNYSIDTNKLRISIGENHPLYSLLDRDVIAITEGSDTALLIVVEDKEGTIRFSESTTYGKWKRIGNAGIRFEGDPST